jgi:hypothetical protein
MGCSSNNENSCCPSKQEGKCHEEKHDEMMGWLLEIADEAWTEVLKDKIKEHIVATQNDRMKELAKIVSEGNSHRWKLKGEKKQAISSFKEKLGGFFGQSKK